MAASDKHVRKAIFSIDVSKVTSSLSVRKGTACAVITEESPDRLLLVTSRKVIEHGGTLTEGIVRPKRFCSKVTDRGDKHVINYTFVPRCTEKFCYILLQQPLKYALKLVSASKLREAGRRLRESSCLSYTFFGTSFTTLTWEFDETEKTHVLTKIEPQGELVESAHRGSPVVSMGDDDRAVIGVVDCTCDGDLCVTFFTERLLEDIKVAIRGTDARDETDSPLISPESRSAVGNPEEEQENRPGVSSSPTDLSGPLSHMGLQETTPEKQKNSLEKRSEENKCIWDREVQSLAGFQDLLTSVLKINLDPKRELGGDFRSLAGALGKDMKDIWYLESTSSPTEELLKEKRPTLRLLKELLVSKKVGREDVVREITAWVKSTGCSSLSCSNCDLSLR